MFGTNGKYTKAVKLPKKQASCSANFLIIFDLGDEIK
jgi:hypothetical protein